MKISNEQKLKIFGKLGLLTNYSGEYNRAKGAIAKFWIRGQEYVYIQKCETLAQFHDSEFLSSTDEYVVAKVESYLLGHHQAAAKYLVEQAFNGRFRPVSLVSLDTSETLKFSYDGVKFEVQERPDFIYNKIINLITDLNSPSLGINVFALARRGWIRDLTIKESGGQTCVTFRYKCERILRGLHIDSPAIFSPFYEALVDGILEPESVPAYQAYTEKEHMKKHPHMYLGSDVWK